MNQEKRRVLQLCHGYAPPFDDVARQWARLFDSTDYQLTTIFLTGEEDQQVAESVGGEVLFWEYTSKDLRGLKRGLVKRLRNLCQEKAFDVCVAQRYKAIYLALSISGLKVVGVNHAYGVYDRWLRRLCVLRQKDRLLLVGVSNAIRDDIRESMSSFPAEKIQTVYNHIDVLPVKRNQVDREEARSFLNLSGENYIFGAVGRLHPDKDYETLISGFSKVSEKMPNAHLVIIGRGHLEGNLIAQADALGVGDRVHFLGFVKEAYRYFKGFDSFVLSSDHEPFGMVLLEAMLAEIPIVYSDCGGAPEVVGSLGLPFQVGNSEELSNALLDVYSKQYEFGHKQLTGRVNSHFSDTAVKNAFWSMSSLKGFLSDP
jgi:glycosyltransferase involved in cell wall biosynthesis